MDWQALICQYDSADSLFLAGQWTQARKHYSDILTRFGKLPKALFNRGLCFLRENRLNEALADFNQAEEMNWTGKARVTQVKSLIAPRSGLKADLEAEQTHVAALRNTSSADTQWTVLPSQWYSSWETYVKEAQPTLKPLQVDYTLLIDTLSPTEYFLDPENRGNDGKIKADLREKEHFLVLPTTISDYFDEKYGKKGEKIILKTHTDLHYFEIQADILGVENKDFAPKKMLISRLETVKDVKSRLIRCAKALFPLTSVKDSTRMWKINKNEQNLLQSELKKGVSLQISSILEEKSSLNITESDILVLEFQQLDGNWWLNKKKGAICANCSKENAANICGGCRKVHYCSRDCQLSHFKQHKFQCKPATVVKVQSCGLRGLANLGNTCYMNTAVQCLARVTSLTQYFLTRAFETDISRGNPLGSEGVLARAYANLLSNLHEGGEKVVVPHEFRRVMVKLEPQFSGFSQHDCQEFLSFLIDRLHEDVNKVGANKPQTPQIEGTSSSDDLQVAGDAWAAHLLRNDSALVSLLHGQCKSTLICPTCSRVSITFDPVMMYTLQISHFEVRKVTVFFVPLETGFPRKICLVLRGTVSIGELKALLTPVIKTTEVVLWTLAGSKLQRQLSDSHSVEDTRGQVIFAYETEAEYDFIVPVLQSCRKEGDLSWTRVIFSCATDPVCSLSRKIAQALEWPLSQMKMTAEDYEIRVSDGKKCLLCSDTLCKGCSLPEEMTVEELVNSAKPLSLEVFWRIKGNNLSQLNVCEGSDFPVVSQNSVTPALSECLSIASKPEILDAENTWYCSVCKEHVQATKKYELFRAPQVFIIHLKRFKPRIFDKIDLKVDFPLVGLEVSTLTGKGVYDLVAVANHAGVMYGGHYTAYVRGSNSTWYHLDDDYVTAVRPEEVVSKYAYLLVYERREICLG